MTMSTGPRMASRVFSRAPKVDLGAKSSSAMLPSAPWMSPRWALSSTAVSIVCALVSPSIVRAFTSLMIVMVYSCFRFKGLVVVPIGWNWSAHALFGQLFGNAECVGAGAHLDPDIRRIDAGAMPQRNEVVEQIGALSNDASGVVFDRLERHFSGFLDHFLGGLAGARCEQSRRAWMILRRYLGKRSIETIEFVGLRAWGRDAGECTRR